MIEKTIYKTNNYSQFKLIEQNRKKDSGHVMNIMNSISNKNLLEDMPILVDNNMNVIDGQHRLEACRLGNFDVFYKFASVSNVNDIVKINNVSKKWKPEDYLNQFIKLGNINYIKFKEFMDWSGITTIGIAKKFLSKEQSRLSTTGMGSSISSNVFNSGNFQWIDDEDVIKKRVIKYKKLGQYCQRMYDRSAIQAFDFIEKTDGINYDDLINKLSKTMIPPYKSGLDLIDHLEKIYNSNRKYENKVIFRRP